MATHAHDGKWTHLPKLPWAYLGATNSVYQACQGAPPQPGYACDHCGTGIMIVHWFKSVETGQRFGVGSTCVHRMAREMDSRALAAAKSEIREARNAKARERNALERAARLEREEKERDLARTTFLAAYDGLAEALEMNHPILRDMTAKLMRYGSLSDKQIAFALKLADEIRNPPPEEPHAVAPLGKQSFIGTVVSLKNHETFYGMVLKMTVKVSTERGIWLAWGTVQQSIVADVERGSRVQIKATLEAGREPHFVFMKRPRATLIAETLGQTNAQLSGRPTATEPSASA